MIVRAVYEHDNNRVEATLERIETYVESQNQVLNFPRIIEIEKDKLILVCSKMRHGSEPLEFPQKRYFTPAMISEDAGKNWVDLGEESDWTNDVQTSGILGYLKDGRIAYINVFPLEAYAIKYKRTDGHWHYLHQVKDPTFKIRYFSSSGKLEDTSTFKLIDIPWEMASYELYGSLLELDDGSYITAFQAHVGIPSNNKYAFKVFIGRSYDKAETFKLVHVFDPLDFDLPPGNQGFSEPDMAILANGDILCVIRTGSHTPLYQSRSKDGGATWSEPVNVGWPGVKPSLKLLENGVLACSGGRGVYGHPQVTYAMFSLDGTGEKWEYPFAFHTGPGCSYTSNMQRNGKFCVVYSDSDFTKPLGSNQLSQQAIRCAVIDVKRT